MCIDFYDKDWNHQPFMEPRNYQFAKHEIEKPVSLEKMWDLARLLCKGFHFVRVDLYNLNGKIFFGELTFFPTNGMGGFEPDEYDDIFGSYIKFENTSPTN